MCYPFTPKKTVLSSFVLFFVCVCKIELSFLGGKFHRSIRADTIYLADYYKIYIVNILSDESVNIC